MARPKWFTAWCPLFESILEERGMKVGQFAEMVGDDHNNISQYISGHIRPPLTKLDAWADKLSLDPDVRRRFLRLAHLAHTNQYIKDELEEMREKARKIDRLVADQDAALKALSAYVESLKAQLRARGIEPVSPLK